MGRATVALVWLIMVVGIGVAFGMGEADGRKRAEDVAAARESEYQDRIQEVCRMLRERVTREEATEGIGEAPPDASPEAERLARARAVMPPDAAAAPPHQAIAARGS